MSISGGPRDEYACGACPGNLCAVHPMLARGTSWNVNKNQIGSSIKPYGGHDRRKKGGMEMTWMRTSRKNRVRWVLIAALAALTAGASVWAAYGTWGLSGFQGQSVWYVAVDPETPATVYATSMMSGLCGSTDGGYTWSTTNFPAPGPVQVAIDSATTPHTLYVGAVANKNVYRGIESAGTRNWTSSGSGINGGSFVTTLAVDTSTNPSSTVLAGTGNAIAFTNKGVYYSTDGGQNWNAGSGFPTVFIPFVGTRPNISQCVALEVDPVHAGTVYAGFLIDGVYKSTNHGHSWSKVGTCPLGAVASMGFDPAGTLWVAGATANITTGPFKVYKSSDGGTTWDLALDLGYTAIPYSLVADDLGRVYVGMVNPGATTGIYVTADGGSTWASLNDGLGGGTVLALAEGAGTVYAGVGSPVIFSGNNSWGLYAMHYRPAVWNISPDGGPTTGGTSVTIAGTDFSGTTDVAFGSVPGTSFTVDSDRQITAFSPSQPSGTVDVTVTGTDGTSPTTAADQFTYTCPSFSFAPDVLLDATVGASCDRSVQASGGTAPYTYSVAANTLPPGLSLNTDTGAITGIPGATGEYTFTIQAEDANHCTGSRTYTLKVVCPVLTLMPASPLPDATASLPYRQVFSVTGGSGSYTYGVIGALPPGLVLSGDTLSGTPTRTGTFTFGIIAEDAYACPASRPYTLAVVCPAITLSPASLPAAVKGQAYDQALTPSAGVSPFTFDLTGGALPDGITLSSDGVVSGTPSVSGSFNLTVTVTDANGCTGTGSYTFATYTSGFHDDGNTSALCVDGTTGAFQWATPGGKTFTGTLNVYNGGTMFWSRPGASQYVYLYYDPNGHTAWGYLYDYTTGLYSSLYDSNTLNDPPGCGVTPPPV